MTKSRKMRRGGFWESVTSGWNSVSEGASSLWGPKKTTPSSSSSSSENLTVFFSLLGFNKFVSSCVLFIIIKNIIKQINEIDKFFLASKIITIIKNILK